MIRRSDKEKQRYEDVRACVCVCARLIEVIRHTKHDDEKAVTECGNREATAEEVRESNEATVGVRVCVCVCVCVCERKTSQLQVLANVYASNRIDHKLTPVAARFFMIRST